MSVIYKMMFAAVSAATLVSPAYAVVTVCGENSCLPQTAENVLIENSTGALSIAGHTNTTGVGITFTSPIGEMLTGPSNGQARVEALDGLLNGLTFTLDDGFSFRTAVFNLSPLPGNEANEAIKISLTYLLSDGGFATDLFDVRTNGENFFGISGDAGERFTSITFLSDPVETGIGDLRQLRLGGVGAVPEPASWAMLIAGFGLVGAAARRRRLARRAVLA